MNLPVVPAAHRIVLHVRKAGKPLDTKATSEIVADYLTWHVVVNGGESIIGAIDLEERYQSSFWDALVIHAAQSAGVDVLYSEDLSDRQRYGQLQVVNPLVNGASP